MSVRAYLYDAEGKDREVPLDEATANLSVKQLLRVDLTAFGESEVRRVAVKLGLPREAAENLLEPTRRPRLDNYGEFFQLVIDAIQDDGKGFRTEELDFVVGPNVVVTAHREPIDFLESFDRRVRGDTRMGQLDAPAFLAALLDWHITNYFRAVENLEAEVDRLDERALNSREDRDLLPELVRLRQRVASIRRALTPHREVYSALVRPDLTPVAESNSAAHFGILHDRLERAIEAAENARELLVGSFAIHTTQVAQRTNDIVKALTLISLVLLPMSTLAGIMGMNMKARIFESGDPGFWGVVALMALGALGTLLFARRRRWI
jgi:magnesium/cobalt transport protein CorA